MNEESYDIDLEMLGDFIDESLESMHPLPECFVRLEKEPQNIEVIQEIFRPIHSLKGNAGYFGLMKTKALAHEMESVLDLLRKEKLAVSSMVIDSLLAGIDVLLANLEASRNGTESVVHDDWQACMDTVHTLLEKKQETPEQANERMWRDTLALYDKLKDAIDEDPDHMAIYAEVKAKLFNLAPEAMRPTPKQTTSASDATAMAALQAIAKDDSLDETARIEQAKTHLEALAADAPSEATKDLVAKLQDEVMLFLDRIGWDGMVVSLIDDAADAWNALVMTEQPAPAVEVPKQEVAGAEDIAPEPVVEKTPENPVETKPEPATKNVEEPTVQAKSSETKDVTRTMRVSELSIDSFLGFVGELIAVDEMFRHIHTQFVKQEADIQLCSSLLRVINIFSKLSDDLQRSIMEIRKVSVRPLLQKNARIARDVAIASNKEIETIVEGSEVQIDRSLIETLEAPMVHMVRNAADHGIELPDLRASKGKPSRGQITVRIEEIEDEIQLTIADDGKGLDYEKIRQKAITMGKLDAKEPMNQAVLQEFIFSSGFSTAEAVTDISGRGVGMEAVRNAIEGAGGHINVESEVGVGTQFIIRLPKSVGTQILPSFVVKINNERYVIPMDRIRGSFSPKLENLNRFPDGSVGVRLSGKIYPVVSLAGVYEGELEPVTGKILVRIESKVKPFTILVDEIIGIQKVVLRTVPWIEFDKFLGSAVMGDGFVSMIINVAALEQNI